MSETKNINQNKKTKTIAIIGVLITIILIAVIAVVALARRQTKPECETCGISENSNTGNSSNNNGDTITYNAYDFIIEKMGQAQYWTYEEFEPIYQFRENKYLVTRDHVIKNATGWVLYDEDTASFVRGFESRLVIDFANYKAYGDTEFNLHKDITENAESLILTCPVNEDPDHPGEEYTYVYKYDFNKGTWKFGSDSYQVPFDGSYKDVYSPYREIYNTFEFYNDIFTELGIPLLNQPEGTLASYKNKTIQVPKELVELKYVDRWNDDLIHAPWDDQDWSWYWEEDEGTIWLDHYMDVYDQQFPEANEADIKTIPHEHLDGSVTYERVAYYTPVFLVFDYYGRSAELEKEGSTNYYPNETAAFFTYYVKPLYKHIFGYNGVYFAKISQLNGSNMLIGCQSKEVFANSYSQTGLPEGYEIFNEGDLGVGYGYVFYSIGNRDQLVKYMNELVKYYNSDNIFGEDYAQNFALIYEPGDQSYLGLR